MNIFTSEADNAFLDKNYRKALNLYKKALISDPNNPRLLAAATECSYNLARVDEALSLGKASVAIKPSLSKIHVLLSYLYATKGDNHASRSEAEIALELDPNSACAICCYGTLLVFERNYKDAISYLSKAISVEPKLYLAHYNLSVCYQEMNDFAGQYRQVKTLFKLKPNLRNFATLTGMYLSSHRLLQIILILSPIPYIFIGYEVLFIPHFLLVCWFIYAAIISGKNRLWKNVKQNLIMAGIYVAIDFLVFLASITN
ncbi:MAG: tetratricopeptide repeat protein [Chloroflexi bacterium]|nr:tetratricopeptide repeat protein [Chloroflexota bacterium]